MLTEWQPSELLANKTIKTVLLLNKRAISATLSTVVTKNKVSSDQVEHIAQLAAIPTSDKENQQLAQAFAETLDVVDELKKVDVSQVETTHQVTGFKNVTRADIVDQSASFTQQEALANAPKQQDGYFVVPQILQAQDH